LTQANFFELFGLAPSFSIDASTLDAQWKARAAQVHPDRFVNASPPEKRVAMQWSTQLNEAYRVLRDPLQRAKYLCELAGQDVTESASRTLGMAFLSQQMEWREALENLEAAHDEVGLAALLTQVEGDRARCQKQTSRLIEQQHWPDALKSLNEWMFIEKFVKEVQVVKRAQAATE
jgi:molecular chaperone HscB